jgi:hypothetical protein
MKACLNIDTEIEKLLKIKEIVDDIAILRVITKNLQVVSEARYDFLLSKKLLKPDTYYYIAPIEVRPYVENYYG